MYTHIRILSSSEHINDTAGNTNTKDAPTEEYMPT